MCLIIWGYSTLLQLLKCREQRVVGIHISEMLLYCYQTNFKVSITCKTYFMTQCFMSISTTVCWLTFQDWVPVQDGAAHEHHTVSRHSSWGRIVNVVHLKDDLTIRGHGDTITISQGQGLVVIQYRVKVLNPDGVYWTVQHQPHMLTLGDKVFPWLQFSHL